MRYQINLCYQLTNVKVKGVVVVVVMEIDGFVVAVVDVEDFVVSVFIDLEMVDNGLFDI